MILDGYEDQIGEWLGEGLPKAEIARRLKVKQSTLKDHITRMKSGWTPSKPGLTHAFSGREGTATLIRDRITSLDDLIAACEIDLDTWEVVSYQAKCWEMGRKAKCTVLEFNEGVTSGSVNDSGKIHIQPLYSVSAKFKVRTEKTHKELADHLREALRTAPPIRQWIKPVIPVGADDTLEVMVPDLHFGLRAEDYNMQIAQDLFEKAVYNLVAQSGDNIKRICLPIGNDYFNVDNLHGTTTRGTKQDEEGLFYESFTWGWKMLVGVIENLSQRYEVDVLVIPGNHDTERSYYLGEVLSAYFRNHNTVNIDNDPTTRKYRLFGITLIGYTHGDKEPPKDLPMIMAQQQPQMWARSLFREWHQGHLHHEKNNEIQGVKLRHYPSLVAPDQWHKGKGYVTAVRQACAIEYTMTGPVRQYNWFVLTGT